MMNKSTLSIRLSSTVFVILTVRLATALLAVQGMIVTKQYVHTSPSEIQGSMCIRTNVRMTRYSLRLGATKESRQSAITEATASASTTKKKQQKRPRPRQQRPLQKYDYGFDNDDDDDDEILSSLSFEVDSFQELQRSMGSEVLDYELQKQIDSTNETPNSFLETHVTDASYLEKVAMSTVPEQLPQPAINAFRHRQQLKQQLKKQQPKKKKETKIIKKNIDDRRRMHGLEFAPSHKRVNPEEEIELAKIIQRGVWLHKLKTDKEAEKGCSINKNEWADLANLDNATQLRREVATYRRAKQLLVSANMGLVHAVVKRQYHDVRKRTGSTYEELIQEGSLGLIRAAELFDPLRGVRFSTYATIWIKGLLNHSHLLDGSIILPAREKTKWNKIVKAQKDITNEKGDFNDDSDVFAASKSVASFQEIANRLDMKVEDVVKTQSKMSLAKNVLSLDYEYQTQRSGGNNSAGGKGQQLLMEMDKNFQADSDIAERTQMQADIIASMVRNLTPREARLIRLRYGLTTDGQTRTVQECADAMGVSQASASNLAARCLKKLREAAEADSLQEYLLTIA
mmetsp:Transcript_26329/g.29572  ORF Transcript_26329/g.29572 Transcript_26329/m.29572 type:complete len:570 (+) Transcript_26329:127-1836(+)